MAWSDFYAELKGWQGLIGSALGFLALIGGALFNAHLNRKRDDRLRLAEAKIVALSLYGEINLLRRDIASLANGLGGWYIRQGAYGRDELPAYFREVFSLRNPTLYNALASKIGPLEVDLLLAITKFYSDYEEAVSHFPMLFENEERQISYGIEWVLDPAIAATNGAEGAVRRIEEIGNILVPATTPDVQRGQKALELAEDLRPDHD